MELHFTEPSDWYALTHELLARHHGSALSNYYDKSMLKLLKNIFPEHEWHAWLLKRTPNVPIIKIHLIVFWTILVTNSCRIWL